MAPGEAELTVRPARPEDRPALLDLLALCLGEGSVPRTAELWSWKHLESPFGPSPILVAEAEGRPVGLRAFLRWRWRSGGREVPAVRAVDTATHPDWRGRGVFSTLTRSLLEEVAAEGAAFVFNTPNRVSGRGYRKLGWRTVGRAPALVRALRPLGTALRLARPEGGGPGSRRGEAPDLSGFPTAATFLASPFAGELIEALVEDRRDPRYRTALDLRYLQWRYGSPPGLDYRALWSEEPGDPAAVIFRGRARGRLREVLVTELLAPAGEPGEQRSKKLLQRLATGAGADYLVAVASPRTGERRALLRGGLLPAPGVGPRIVVRRLATARGLPDPGEPSAWRWSAGALELF